MNKGILITAVELEGLNESNAGFEDIRLEHGMTYDGHFVRTAILLEKSTSFDFVKDGKWSSV